jgi:hypothetical protein
MHLTARLLSAATRQRFAPASVCLPAAASGTWARWLGTSTDHSKQTAGTSSVSSSSGVPDGESQHIQLVRSYDIKGTPLSQVGQPCS